MTALQTRPRVLTVSDAAAFGELVRRDPVLNCVLDSRLRYAPDLDSRRFGGFIWGIEDGAGSLRAAIFHGGNLIPLGDDREALGAIAEHLARSARGCSSIVGARSAVRALWPTLSRAWGDGRMVRDSQPLLVTTEPAPVRADPEVREVRPTELRAFLPGAIAMFTEELGISPLGRDSGASYRARVAEMIAARRAFARFDDAGRLEFKAEIGSLGSSTAQVQGVWVRPDLRGRGIGTAAMATVIQHGLRRSASVSLYVNDFNVAARSMYHRLGMRQVNTLSTILF